MQEAPIHQSHVYGQIKILPTLFEKGYQRNIPVKLFQNLTNSFGEKDFLRISSCPYIVQEAPIYQSHVFGRIKISRTIFEKGHLRNIPAKLFQNLTSGFREKSFLRIFSCPYSARSPHSAEPCFWADQNFANIFLKGHPRNIPVKLFQNLTNSFGEEDFLRISSCPYSARSPHSPEPCFWADQDFANIFEKGHQRNIPMKLFQNRTSGSRGEDF